MCVYIPLFLSDFTVPVEVYCYTCTPLSTEEKGFHIADIRKQKPVINFILLYKKLFSLPHLPLILRIIRLNDPKGKEIKKAKWLFEEALHIGKNRREKQGRRGKICPTECRVPENSK